MKVVILVPRRADNGRRDTLWAFTKAWLTENHPTWRIIEGDSTADEGPFNRGLAINRAAAKAGKWDVAIVHDGDNIVHPAKLKAAVTLAHTSQHMTFAHDTYMYLDRESSDAMLAEDAWFPRPQIDNVRTGYAPYIIHKHISGVQAVPRAVWDATGGFVEELRGWGSDDSMFAVLCNVFGGGVQWVPGTCLHLWHEHTPSDTARVDVRRNREHLARAKRFERAQHPDQLRDYLATVGHLVP